MWRKKDERLLYFQTQTAEKTLKKRAVRWSLTSKHTK